MASVSVAYSQFLAEEVHIVPNYNGPIYVGLWNASLVCYIDNFLKSLGILRDVYFLIFYPMIVKELLDFCAIRSAHRSIYGHHMLADGSICG